MSAVERAIKFVLSMYVCIIQPMERGSEQGIARYMQAQKKLFCLQVLSEGWTEAEREHLGQEMSDVLLYLVRLAEQCEIDLPAAVLDKFKLNAAKYPPGKEGEARLKYSTQEGKKTDNAMAQSK